MKVLAKFLRLRYVKLMRENREIIRDTVPNF